MKTLKKIVFTISPLAMAVASNMVHATSAVGTDNHLGNEMNPSGLPVLCEPSPEGLTSFSKDSRTPTGLRYQQPCLKPENDPEGDGWIVYGTVEAGVTGSGGDDKNAYFVEYADRDDGPIITVVSLSARDSESASYAEFSAGNLGRDDEHLEAEYGVAGSYKARFTYNKIPHVYATNAKSPYQGIGSGNLTLPAEIPVNSVSNSVPGSTEGLDSFIDSQSEFELSVNRERMGLSGDYEITEGVKAYVDYKHEQRDGLRAFGGSFNFDFLGLGIGSVNEVIEPIDYMSHDITAGFSINADRYNLNASYTGSFFSNRIDSLTYENPWNTGFGGFTPATGQSDLAPDNQFNQLRLEGNYQLPSWKGLATFSLSRGRMEQDDKLLPFTSNTGVLPFGVNLDDWNTTAALQRDSAEARIDTGVEQLKLSFKPTDKLGMKFGYRHYEEDNKTSPFASCNQITDQCAFVFLDAGLAGAFGSAALFRLFDPDNGVFTNFHYLSVPWDYEKNKYTAGFSYLVQAKTRLGFDYELEKIQRSYREVDETDENKFRFNIVHRDGGWGTIRVEAGYAERRYDGNYNSNPYEHFYTEELLHDFINDPGTAPASAAAAQAALNALAPHTLSELRKSDLSERDQMTFAAKVNLALNEKTDLMLTADYKDNDYDAAYGLDYDKTKGVGLEISQASSVKSDWYMSYYFQSIKSSMRNIDSTEIGTDGSAGGTFYPFANEWSSGEDETSHMIGVGLNTQLAPDYRLGLGYAYGLTKTKISYAAASAAALAASQAGANPVGSFDDIRYEQHQIELNLRGRVTDVIGWRMFAQYEIGRIEDFHYEGIQRAENEKLSLGTDVDDWDAFTVGLQAQYQF